MFGLRLPQSDQHEYQEDFDSSSSEDEDIGQEEFESVQDDFEEEMRQEMESHATGVNQPIPGPSVEKEDKLNEEDELLYDPNADDEDEKWIERTRKEYLGFTSEGTKSSENNGLKCPDSDAVLNCPGCMTVLCLDCQRHEVYKTQYRAMFVFNCNIDWSEKMTGKKENNKDTKGKGRKKKEMDCKSLESEPDSYFNVRCSVCSTQVAVYDDDEVFHFFNVLSSYS